MLRPLFARFEEGLGTADLVEARAVLTSISPNQVPGPR
jgi:hypothetical protein